jgi:hypothetical protein
MRFTRLAVTLLAFAVATTPATARQIGAMPVDSGTLVRVTLVTNTIVRGRLLERFSPSISDTFVFCSYPASPCASKTDPLVRSLPVAKVTKLEVGVGSHWVRGGLIGAGIGTVLMAAGIYFNNGLCESDDCLISRAWVISGAAVGFGIGALFGGSSVRWEHAH